MPILELRVIRGNVYMPIINYNIIYSFKNYFTQKKKNV